MKTVAVLNAFGSTVGDNLEHALLVNHLKAKGLHVRHLWNFRTQHPHEVKKTDALILGPAGVIWYGAEGVNRLREFFFLWAIKMSKKAAAISVGYNMADPLNKEWKAALNKLELITTRDSYTFRKLKGHVQAPLIQLPCLAWIYRPHISECPRQYTIGTAINARANMINYKTSNPFNFKGLKWLDIPFAEPIEAALTPTYHNKEKCAQITSATIRKCKALLAGRLHGFILGLLNMTPTIAINDTMKLLSQAEMCGYPWIYELDYLRSLDREGWLELIEIVKDTDFNKIIERMTAMARRHFVHLDTWLDV